MPIAPGAFAVAVPVFFVPSDPRVLIGSITISKSHAHTHENALLSFVDKKANVLFFFAFYRKHIQYQEYRQHNSARLFRAGKGEECRGRGVLAVLVVGDQQSRGFCGEWGRLMRVYMLLFSLVLYTCVCVCIVYIRRWETWSL